MPPADDQLGLLLIPPSWTELLKRIQSVCPSAVIAGGALRDLDNGRPVKDLDVFLEADSESKARQIMEDLGDAGFAVSWDESFGENVYPEDQNLEVVAVMDLLGFDIAVQLIFVAWPTIAIVERFDYGICRLSWDGAKLVRPPEYDLDKASRLFRLRRDRPTPVSMRGSIRRYARLVNEKYEGWDWWPYESDTDGLDPFSAFNDPA